MYRIVSGALALLLSLSCATPRPAPLREPTGNGAARERWLFEQRAYPFGEIPADGRRRALDDVRRDGIAAHAVENAAAVQWRALGPMPVVTWWPWRTATGRVKALAISPANPNLILAGSSSGGVWRSADGGATFAPVSDTHADLSIGAIGFAPSNPTIAYAISGSDFLGSGVLRSTDAGLTWRSVSNSTFAPRGTANRIVIDPSNANRLFVAQTSRQDAASGMVYSSGLMRSENGGVSWTSLFPGIISDFAASPSAPSTFLLGVPRHDGGGAAGVYRSTNSGQTWTLVVAGKGSFPRFSFSFSQANPSRVYLHSRMENIARIHVSNDGGATWTETVLTALGTDRPSFLATHPSNESQIYIGYPGGDLHVSADGGVTWENLTKSLNAAGDFDPARSASHIDQHALAFSPANHDLLYLANDGGIFRSSDRGRTYTSLASTLSLVQAYRVTAHPLDPSLLYLGTQDNGLERRRGDEWRELVTGDYSSILFDVNNPARFITNYVYGTTLAFNANGDGYEAERSTSETFGEDEDDPRIAFIAPFEQHKRTNTLYFGSWRLFRSSDFGRTWAPTAGMTDLTKGGFDTLSAIGLALSDPNTIYTGSSQGAVKISRDGGTNWQSITTGLPDRSVKSIAVDRTDANRAWIAFSGYRTAHVYRTDDFGSSWRSMSSGLPDVPVNTLFIDPKNANVVYAGTDIGPFRLDSGSSSRWEYIGTGMPPVVVTAFDVTADGRIVASTYGRGAYELVTEAPARRRSVRH